MPMPIKHFSVIHFESALEATRAAMRIMDYVATPLGVAFLDGPLRAVIWIGHPEPSGPALFLSDGGLEAAAASGLRLPVSEELDQAALPAFRALLLGDAMDWR
jgi:hypothetical protein